MRGSKKIVVMDSSGIKLICFMRVVKNVRWSGVKFSAFCLSLVVGPEESCIGMGRSWGRTRGAGAVAAAGDLILKLLRIHLKLGQDLSEVLTCW